MLNEQMIYTLLQKDFPKEPIGTKELLTRYVIHMVVADDNDADWWAESSQLIRPSLPVPAEECVDLMLRKHRLYGSKQLLIAGSVGVVVRSIDKICRIETMTENGLSDRDEPLTDAYADLFNYALIGNLLSRGGVT
jgi:hypothetical protein